MQDCFRQHPEIYGGEFEDDESSDDDDPAYSNPQVDDPSIPPPLDPSLPVPAVNQPSVPLYTSKNSVDKQSPPLASDSQTASAPSNMSGGAATGAGVVSRKTEEPASESQELVPKAWHDTVPSKGGV